MEATIDPTILKAAALFVSKEDTRYYLKAPWVQRIKGRSVVMATNGHAMFVAEDKDGKHYPKKPWMVGSKPGDVSPVDWPKVIRSCGRPKKPGSVYFNPNYLQKIMRAAKILGLSGAHVSLSGPMDPATVHLGATAMALLMPMRAEGVPHIPGWLGETIAAPATKSSARSKKKPTRAKSKGGRSL